MASREGFLDDTPLMKYSVKNLPEEYKKYSPIAIYRDVKNDGEPVYDPSFRKHVKVSEFHLSSSRHGEKENYSEAPNKGSRGREPLFNRTNHHGHRLQSDKKFTTIPRVVTPEYSDSDHSSPVRVRVRIDPVQECSFDGADEFSGLKYIKSSFPNHPNHDGPVVKSKDVAHYEGLRYYEKERLKLENETTFLRKQLEAQSRDHGLELESTKNKFLQEMKLLQQEYRAKSHSLELDLRQQRDRSLQLEQKLIEREKSWSLGESSVKQSLEKAEKVIEALQLSQKEAQGEALVVKGKYEALYALHEQLEKKHAESIHSLNAVNASLASANQAHSKELERLQSDHVLYLKNVKDDHDERLLYLKGKWRQQADDKIESVKKKLMYRYESLLSGKRVSNDSPLVNTLTQQIRNLESALSLERSMSEKQRESIKLTIEKKLHDHYRSQIYSLKEKCRKYIHSQAEETKKERTKIVTEYEDKIQRLNWELTELRKEDKVRHKVDRQRSSAKYDESLFENYNERFKYDSPVLLAEISSFDLSLNFR